MRIIDIRYPYTPYEIGFYNLGGASKVIVSQNYAYLANGEYGLRVIDISDPYDLVESGYFETGGFVQDVTVSGNRLYVADLKGGITILQYNSTAAVVSSEDESNYIAEEIRLSHNYPNPFNSSTTITYQINSINHITLSVYSVTGQRIKILKDEIHSPGIYNVRWDGKNSNGLPVSNGMYFSLIRAGDNIQSCKMLLVK